jgi:hypothetical protein
VNYFLGDEFKPAGPTLDIAAVCAAFGYGPPDPHRPIFGIYSKYGPSKGIGELLEAIGLLDSKERPNLVVINGSADVKSLVADAQIQSTTWVLPFMPPWVVPQFLRGCDVVFFLENDFPIQQHHPIIPEEVLATGRCLVTTPEIVRKQRFALTADETAYVVDTVRVESLATVVRRILRERRWVEIGQVGHEVWSSSKVSRDVAGELEQILQDASAGRVSPWSEDMVRGLLRKLFATSLESGLSEIDLEFDDLIRAWGDPAWLALCRSRMEGMLNSDTLEYDQKEALRHDEIRVWQTMGTDTGNFDYVDQWAMGRGGPLEAFFPVKSRGLRVETMNGVKTLVVRKENLLDNLAFRISDDTERLLDMCDGTLSTSKILSSWSHSADVRRVLVGLYKAGAIIFLNNGPEALTRPHVDVG